MPISYRRHRPVCFDSPGGSIAGAIALGNAVSRRSSFNTCLGEEYATVSQNSLEEEEVFLKGVVCASACVFALAGGLNRYVSENAKIGVHQFAATEGQIGDSNVQYTVVALAAYLERMGVSRNLVDIASVVSSDKIYWLTPKEIKVSRIENISVAFQEWRLDTTNDGIVFATVSQEVPENHCKLTLIVRNTNSGPTLMVISEPPKLSDNVMDEALEAVNNKAISLYVDEKEIVTFDEVRWRLINESSVATALPLSLATLNALKSGKRLSLLIHTPRYLRIYDPSAEFRLDGLNRLLTGVLK